MDSVALFSRISSKMSLVSELRTFEDADVAYCRALFHYVSQEAHPEELV
jgi:hypothetical protein